MKVMVARAYVLNGSPDIKLRIRIVLLIAYSRAINVYSI